MVCTVQPYRIRQIDSLADDSESENPEDSSVVTRRNTQYSDVSGPRMSSLSEISSELLFIDF